MSQLREYAEKELRRAGMYDADADYGPGDIAKCVLKMIDALSSYGHSGGSHEVTLEIFNRVARFRPLTDLTNDPGEWMEVGGGFWQSRRNPTCFSADGGKTYYDLDIGKENIFTAAEPPQPAPSS